MAAILTALSCDVAYAAINAMNTTLLRLLNAACLSALLVGACAAQANATDGRATLPTNPPLEVESVVLRLIEEAEVPAQEAGVVTDVKLREGQRVKQGDVMAQIDDQVARLAVEAASAQFDIARAKATNDVRIRFARKALEVSEAELRRSMESVERVAKSVSQSQIDVERLTVQKNRLDAEQADHEQHIAALEMNAKQQELSAAREQVARRKIVAPINGVIVQVYVRQGEWVEPGQKAMRVVNVNRLKAEGFISAAAASNVSPGTPVQITLVSSPQETESVAGKIAFVSPEVDPITSQVRIWAEIDNHKAGLRPGQPARMTIQR
jgi:multidrug efflux pump subunit AcrA (membrane-fusion protein)